VQLEQAWFWQCCTVSAADNSNTPSGTGIPLSAIAGNKSGHFRWHTESERKKNKNIGQEVMRR
jgi:hypothetical protein